VICLDFTGRHHAYNPGLFPPARCLNDSFPLLLVFINSNEYSLLVPVFNPS
jgi:hypothetical protein